MAHQIRLKEKAEADLAAMPLWLQSSVESYLTRLAVSSSSISRPAVSPPHPPGGMVAETDCGPVDGRSYHITVFFLYSQDETSLIITRIGYY